MTPVLIGLLLVIIVALVVISVVAYPHLREGSPLLTPDGERLARHAGRKIREKVQVLGGGAVDTVGSQEKPLGSDTGSTAGVSGGRAGMVDRGRAVTVGSGSPTGTPGSPGSRSSDGQPGSGSGAQPPPEVGDTVLSQGGSVPDPASGAGSMPRIRGTRVVWSSPPVHLRPDQSCPPSRSGATDRDGESPAAPTPR